MADRDILVTSYGAPGTGYGIYRLVRDASDKQYEVAQILELEGKSNMILRDGKQIIASIAENGENFLCFLDENGQVLQKVKTPYMYMFGQKDRDRIYLASYNQGADSLYDRNSKTLSSLQYPEGSRTHCIRKIGSRILSTDYGLGQLRIYADSESEPAVLNLQGSISYGKDLQLRLFSPMKDRLYLNTEKSNEILILDANTLEEIEGFSLPVSEGSKSAGNSFSEDGSLFAVSVRGEDAVFVYRLTESGSLDFLHKLKTGKTPRDLKFYGNDLLVSCTDSDCIDVFDPESGTRIQRLDIPQPVTFEMPD